MPRNRDFLLTHPAAISKEFFYIAGIFFLSIPIGHSVQVKETHNIDHLRSTTTKGINGWSSEILRLLDKS